MTDTSLTVISGAVAAPTADLVRMVVAEGGSVSDTIDLLFPDVARQHIRVVLVSGETFWAIEPALWPRVRPKAGCQLVVRIVPQGDNLKSVLSIVVAIAATAIAGPLGAALGFGTLGTSLLTFGITFAGGLLLNALFPASGSDEEKERPVFRIDGIANEARPGSPVPSILGQMRVSPPYALPPYTEIVGDLQYIRALFVVGYGPMDLSAVRIGETDIDRFDEIELQVETGDTGGPAQNLVTEQVLEEQYGAELVNNYPRDDFGEIIEDSAAVREPVDRFTASDSSAANVILGFPAGLISYTSEGEEKSQSVVIRIEQRLNGTGSFQLVANLTFSTTKGEPFFRSHRWNLPQRGRYEVRITRLTAESKSSRVQDRTTFTALQSFRPEHPIAFTKPLALVAVRIKATYQLNSTLDNVSLYARRRILDYDLDGDVWTERVSRNPASLYRHVLQGPENVRPTPDAEIDLAGLEDWHYFCRRNYLKYDRNHDFAAPMLEQLAAIAAAGRAAPRHDGMRWGVTVDEPSELVVAHVDGSNSRSFEWSRSYPKHPDAYRVPFLDETNDYRSGERIVPWPGHVGPIDVTEEIILPGKTDPEEVWVETRRRQYEAERRNETYSCVQDGLIRPVTRGDLVLMSFDVLKNTAAIAHVLDVMDDLVILGGSVAMERNKDYAIRFWSLAATDDGTDKSVLRTIATQAGEQSTLQLTGTGARPVQGDTLHFGEIGNESQRVFVTATESGEENTTVLRMMPAAEEIDVLADAEIAPPWDGREGTVGTLIAGSPAVPRIINTAVSPENGTTSLRFTFAPGSGSTVPVASYELRHRASGASAWNVLSTPASSASVAVSDYPFGGSVQVQLRAVGYFGSPSDWTPVATLNVAEPQGLAAAPASAEVGDGLGFAPLSIVTGDGTDLAGLNIYRTATSAFEDGLLVGHVPVTQGGLLIDFTDGDPSRSSQIANGNFASDSVWTKGTGWSIASNVATKTGAASARLSQPITLYGGVTYRGVVTLKGGVSGDIRAVLAGGTDIASPAYSVAGRKLFSLTAVAGNDTFAIEAQAGFSGSIDNVELFTPSAQSAPQGVHHYHVTSINAEGGESAAIYAGVAVIT